MLIYTSPVRRLVQRHEYNNKKNSAMCNCKHSAGFLSIGPYPKNMQETTTQSIIVMDSLRKTAFELNVFGLVIGTRISHKGSSQVRVTCLLVNCMSTKPCLCRVPVRDSQQQLWHSSMCERRTWLRMKWGLGEWLVKTGSCNK